MAENESRWESASSRDRERVELIARTVVNRLLHEPTVRMKEMHDDRVHARMALVRDLFGLTDQETDLGASAQPPMTDPQPAPPLAEVRELRASRNRG